MYIGNYKNGHEMNWISKLSVKMQDSFSVFHIIGCNPISSNLVPETILHTILLNVVSHIDCWIASGVSLERFSIRSKKKLFKIPNNIGPLYRSPDN